PDTHVVARLVYAGGGVGVRRGVGGVPARLGRRRVLGLDAAGLRRRPVLPARPLLPRGGLLGGLQEVRRAGPAGPRPGRDEGLAHLAAVARGADRRRALLAAGLRPGLVPVPARVRQRRGGRPGLVHHLTVQGSRGGPPHGGRPLVVSRRPGEFVHVVVELAGPRGRAVVGAVAGAGGAAGRDRGARLRAVQPRGRRRVPAVAAGAVRRPRVAHRRGDGGPRRRGRRGRARRRRRHAERPERARELPGDQGGAGEGAGPPRPAQGRLPRRGRQ